MAMAPVSEWPASGVTFRVTRGSFEISSAILERAAETGDDFEIRRAFAINMPLGAVAYRREKGAGGALVIRWRLVRVVPL